MVALDPTRGFDDGASLLFDMGDGFGDDGTLWIERAFAAPGSAPVIVRIDFQLFSESQSDFNQFEVKAFAGPDDPDVQADFTTLGPTELVAGWSDYHYETTVQPSGGQVWAALGVRVAWETPRQYGIDKVTATVTPEPAGGVLASGAALGACVASRRKRRQLSSLTRR
jgi:hypothetical protein